jgi:hypothetical protein
VVAQLTFPLDFATYAGNATAAAAFSSDVRAQLASALGLALAQVSVSAPLPGSIVTVATLSDVHAAARAQLQAAATTPLAGSLLSQAATAMLSAVSAADASAASSTAHGDFSGLDSAAAPGASGGRSGMIVALLAAVAAICAQAQRDM